MNLTIPCVNPPLTRTAVTPPLDSAPGLSGLMRKVSMSIERSASSIIPSGAPSASLPSASGTSAVDPATSRAAYSAHTLLLDLNGPSSNYNITGGTAGGTTALTWTASGGTAT